MTESRVGVEVTKRFTATVTKIDDGPNGGFEALVAVFGNLDSQGDIILPGAFTRSLAEWGSNPIPVLWSHQFHDMSAFIGKATAEETSEGLLFHAEYLDVESGQLARKLMAEGLVSEFSFSGRIREGRWVEKDDDFWYEIVDVDLWEAGPCFKGANPETQLLSVKTLATTDIAVLKAAQAVIDEAIATAEKHTTAPPGDTAEPDPPTTPGDAPGEQTTDETSKALADARAFVVGAATKARLALSNPKGGS